MQAGGSADAPLGRRPAGLEAGGGDVAGGDARVGYDAHLLVLSQPVPRRRAALVCATPPPRSPAAGEGPGGAGLTRVVPGTTDGDRGARAGAGGA